jgi:hypothetical protein
MPPIEIIESWAAAIHRHDRLVLEVPRAHGSTSFLKSVLRYATRPCLYLQRRPPKRRQKGVTYIHASPPPDWQAGQLLLDRIVHVSPGPQDTQVPESLAMWLGTNPHQVVAVVTDDPRVRTQLVDLFPPTKWNRIRYSYTEDINGIITENGTEVGFFDSRLWSRGQLDARRTELGRERFRNSFQVRESLRDCSTCEFATNGCKIRYAPGRHCTAWKEYKENS